MTPEREGVPAEARALLDRLQAMQDAIEALYYAAWWTPDRDVDAIALWTRLRDAAGLPPGGSTQCLGPPVDLRDRLQRAEAVVNLAEKVPHYHGDLACSRGDGFGGYLIQDLVKALAAGEKGKKK